MAFNWVALHGVAFHWVALHLVALHWVALHWVALHCEFCFRILALSSHSVRPCVDIIGFVEKSDLNYMTGPFGF